LPLGAAHLYVKKQMSFVPELQHPLYLCSLNAQQGQTLEVVVRYAEANQSPASPIGRDGWDIMSYPSMAKPTATYLIRFNSFIAYMVGDESFMRPDEQAVCEGRQFARFRQSQYLRYIESVAYGQDVCPGMRFHYGIYCLNQLIDVVTGEAPIISYLGEAAR
jgi:hypothetical protein